MASPFAPQFPYKPTSAQQGAEFLSSVAGAALQIFVVTQAWYWFLVPLGAQEIGFWHAGGLVVLWRFLRGYRKPPVYHTEQEWREDVARTILHPLIGWLLLWICWRMQ